MTTSPGYLIRIASPIGRLELAGDGERVTSLTIESGGRLPQEDESERTHAVLREAAQQLDDYFAGNRREFTVPVDLGGTPFRRSVWERIARLEWGEYISYGALGEAIGKPGSARAIGGAVASNPVPILVGCHRVLSATGSVTGYTGGEGITTKLWLLAHEGILLAA